jgi:hypothetical protein
MTNHEDFREQIRSLFESGRQHLIARLMHHTKTGDMDLARIVAQEGPAYLEGGERITFRNLVDKTFPAEAKAKRNAVQKERAKEHEERMGHLAANLKARTAEKRERRLARDFEPVRGWNVPLDVPK